MGDIVTANRLFSLIQIKLDQVMLFTSKVRCVYDLSGHVWFDQRAQIHSNTVLVLILHIYTCFAQHISLHGCKGMSLFSFLNCSHFLFQKLIHHGFVVPVVCTEAFMRPRPCQSACVSGKFQSEVYVRGGLKDVQRGGPLGICQDVPSTKLR